MPRFSEEIIEDLHHEIDNFRSDFKYIEDLAEEILASARSIKSMVNVPAEDSPRLTAIGKTFLMNLEDVLAKAETVRNLADRNARDR